MFLKRTLLTIFCLLTSATAVILYNTLTFKSQQHRAIQVITPPQLSHPSITHLQHAIRYKTISHDDATRIDSAQFFNFINFLCNSYPEIHHTLQREIINGLSLMYTWKGKDESRTPIIMMAHYDVVPVEQETVAMWDTDPFAGTLKNDCIWGRGAVDNKINLVSIMEAATSLIRSGYQPERTIYFVFGHDEEAGGVHGSKAIAQVLEKRKVEPEWVLDEGGYVTRTKIPGLNAPVALLGTSEKGIMTLKCSVTRSGGHSSMPEAETAIDILAKALYQIRNTRAAGRITPSQKDFINTIGPELSFAKRIIFANPWLFSNLIINQYSKTPVGFALNHTTIVPTVLSSGLKVNVVPASASALINIRLLPGDSVKDIVHFIRRSINDDRVQVEVISHSQQSAYTSPRSLAYAAISKTVKATFKGTITTPFLLIGGTDSRHFTRLTKNIIRFSPMVDPAGMHGINERVSLHDYRSAISFYMHLMKAV